MPSQTIVELSKLLYSVKKADIEICPGSTLNSFGPNSTHASPRRDPKSRVGGPKFSSLCVSLKTLLKDSVSAIWSTSRQQVYVELTINGKIESLLYDAPTNTMYGPSSEVLKDTYFPNIALLLYAMGDTSDTFDYTKDAAETMVNGMDKTVKTVTPDSLAYLCDCFYYDLKVFLQPSGLNFECKEFTNDVRDQVQQSIRTNNMATIKTCFDLSSNFVNVSFNSSPTSGPAASSSFSEFTMKAAAGEFLLPYDWDSSQEDHIRQLNSLDDFVPNPTYRKLVNLVYKRLSRVIERQHMGKTGLDAIGRDYTNIIIGGRPGTGKTTTADALSATLGIPIYTTAVTRNTEEDTFEGMTKVASDGKFLLHDTSFLRAFEHGGIVVIEEFNLGDPGVLQGAIGQAIEYPFTLFKDGYQEIKRHPMCVIIGTMNSGTQGAREPNQAYTSRFPFTFTMDDPDDTTFLSILEKHGNDPSLCRKVFKAYSSILRYLKENAHNEEMMLCITMRHCLGALDLLKDEVVTDVHEAILDTMIGTISLRDMELAQETFESAVKPLPL